MEFLLAAGLAAKIVGGVAPVAIPLINNINQQVIMQQQVQIAYYQALTAYYYSKGKRCRCGCKISAIARKKK